LLAIPRFSSELAMNEFTLRRTPVVTPIDVGMNGVLRKSPISAGVLEPLPDITARDWDCLFAAVVERLLWTASDQFAAENDAEVGDVLAAVKANVAECAVALAQLQASARYELSHRDQLAADVEHAHWQLAQAHAEATPVSRDARDLRNRRLALHDELLAGAARSATASG
jgi:hypothetical protein